MEQQRTTGRPHWTTRLGLALLWVACLCLAGLMALLTVFYVATMDLEGAQPSTSELVMGVLTVLGVLLMLTVLVFATRGAAWARRAAAIAGIAVGGLALLAIAVTRSPAPETVGVSLAALIGGVLLLLPRPPRTAGVQRPLT
ncbi:MAG: hypothetical protein ACQEWM_03295 [Actinomycetota bacterium]